MALHKTRKSYLHIVILGVIVGIITELANFLPNDDLFGGSSIAGTFGFWIFSTSLVIYLSKSNKNAMINTFLYLSSMCCSYYLLQGVIDYFTPNVVVTGLEIRNIRAELCHYYRLSLPL